MSMRDQGRVVVGVDGTPRSIAALRTAAEQARARNARLCIVNVRASVREADPFAGYSDAESSAKAELAHLRWQEHDARLRTRVQQLIAESCAQAFGATPTDIEIEGAVLTGDAGQILVELAYRADDLLVVGTHGGRRSRHPLRGSVSRYCATHARCAVLVVPTDTYVAPLTVAVAPPAMANQAA